MKRCVLVVVAACTGGGSGGEQLVELENEGEACLFGLASDPLSFADGAPIHVRVRYDVCLSSSCTLDAMAACSITIVDDHTIGIETRASWIDTSASATACTADCGGLTATCDTPHFVPGDYTFVVGARSVPLTLPSTVSATPCIR